MDGPLCFCAAGARLTRRWPSRPAAVRCGIAGAGNRLFTLAAYRAGMVQSWGISRFNGQLAMLEACVGRAAVALAGRFSTSDTDKAAAIRARRKAGPFGRGLMIQMRIALAATAVSGLVVLILMLS